PLDDLLLHEGVAAHLVADVVVAGPLVDGEVDPALLAGQAEDLLEALPFVGRAHLGEVACDEQPPGLPYPAADRGWEGRASNVVHGADGDAVDVVEGDTAGGAGDGDLL